MGRSRGGAAKLANELKIGGRRAGGGGVGSDPSTFIKGSGRKNMARVNPLAAAPEVKRKAQRQAGARLALKKYMLSKLSGTLLDLSSLSRAQELTAHVACNFNAKGFNDLLFDIIAEDFPAIESLNLSGNSISTLAFFKECAEEHTQLNFVRNLNLGENDLHSFKELENLKPFKLAEIVLRGNPIARGNDDDYARQVACKLPTVEIVDQRNIAELRQQLRPKLPRVEGTSWFQDEQSKTLVVDFCTRYFKALDAQQYDTELLEAYAPDCFFTLTIHRKLGIGYGMRASAIKRSLEAASHSMAAPAKSMFKGRVDCVKALQDKVLCGMRTEHQLHSFEVDAMIVVPTLPRPVITATVHGAVQFTVELSGGKECVVTRCFDRVLVLQQAPEGHSWPAVLCNDALHLRPLSEPCVMRSAEDAPPDPEEARRKVLVGLVSGRTKLTHPYAAMCLEAAEWDVAKALVLFEQRKDSLPADAFSSVAA